MPASRLPAIGRLIVSATFPIADRTEVAADLAVEFKERRDARGVIPAHLWLWSQLARSTPALLKRGLWRGWTGYETPANAMHPGGAPFEGLLMDVRFAARRLRARPLYAALTILTLALGVGGSSAVYAISRTFLIEALPYARENRLAVFDHAGSWSEEELVYLRGKVPGFAGIAGFKPANATMREGGGPAVLINGGATTAEFFDVLGARPMMGRTFASGEDVPGAPPIAVISAKLWRTLGDDKPILGRRLTIDGTPRTVIGVMPDEFWFPDPTTDMWIPAPLDPQNRVGNYLVLGRLSDRTTAAMLPAILGQFRQVLKDRFTGDRWPGWLQDPRVIMPIRDFFFAPLEPALMATLAAMGFILLIACANVAALMLGQVEGRATELAVRSALGANRARIARQVLIESLLIGLVAAALGAGIAALSFRLLVAALPLGALASGVTPDLTVFGAALAIALIAAALVALMPIVTIWRGNLSDVISRSRTGGIGGGSRTAGGLVIGEVALAVLMATGAGLLVRSVQRLYAIEPGLARHGVAVIDVVSPADLKVDERRRLFHELTSQIAAIPGAASASVVQRFPLRGRAWSTGMVIPDRPDVGRVGTLVRIVGPGYFATLGIPLEKGRDFSDADGADRETGVIINAALARRYFPDVDPIGRRLDTGFGPMGRIIGVVGNVAEADLQDESEPVRYLSYDQVAFMVPSQTLVVRTTFADARAVLPAVRNTIERLAPGVAIQEMTTVDAVIDLAVGPARQVMLLLALLTTLALVLGAIGIYGVTSQFVTRRHREWGIRIALGLAPSLVARHVVSRGARLVAIGIVLGVGGMILLARLVTPFLYGIHADDPVAVIAAILTLGLVGVLAALIPALRAARVDPALMLRDQ